MCTGIDLFHLLQSYSDWSFSSVIIINTPEYFFIKSWKTSAVSTTVWMVDTQLCKLRGTSDTFRHVLFFYKKLKNVSCEYDRLSGWNSTCKLRGTSDTFTHVLFFNKKLKNVSCEYNRLNGWNSTLQAAWYIRRVRIIWFLWTKPTIWLLILSFTQNIVRACSMLYPYEGYRSVTPLDAARVNKTIFHNYSVHWYYITLIKGRYYIKHDINVRHGKQNPRRGRWL